jgi:hypothetical protein
LRPGDASTLAMEPDSPVNDVSLHSGVYFRIGVGRCHTGKENTLHMKRARKGEK